MTELELLLGSLEVEWPATPDVAAGLRLEPHRGRRRALALALATAALAAAFAVPPSRSAILHFFHLGGVTVVRVTTLPAAQERPLAAGLGEPIGDAGAAIMLGAPFEPRSHGTLYSSGGFVSTLIGGPLLLSEFGSAEIIKKLVTTDVVGVQIAPGVEGLWLSGPPHDVFFPGVSPRLAGNVLIWATRGITFRLEGRGLEESRALALARAILGTRGG